MILFNEASLANLLETVLYGELACESLGDAAIDLIDYCVRSVSHILNHSMTGNQANEAKALHNLETPKEELQRHLQTTNFQVSDLVHNHI